ncbi:tetratricopeptide repeat protein [Phenylobacterium soli]|uniref:tetratricopeptide repeat protein n=1 Tax=Phenylobacterium soli TaxID=2170551 RepID=UPI001D045D3C|nr:tetratricopeptide repeat protein [Phenylobacterium soli]
MSNPPPPNARPLTSKEVFDRAVAAADAGRHEEAERLLRMAFKAAGGPQIQVTLGITLDLMGRYEEARAILRGVAATAADEPRLGLPLALNLLRSGDYAEGWRFYEGRDIQMTRHVSGKPKLSFPEWQGEPVRSLVVLPEQGFGDEIMFNRYVPLLKARGIEVTLLCRPNMPRLFALLGVRLVPLGPSVEVPRADAWVLAASLPHRLGTEPDTVPDAVYLPGGAPRAGLGVMAVGSAAPDPRRVLPPQLAERLLALPGAVNLDPQVTGAQDFEDTRQLIEPLALVISVDTAIAHLAGAMGKPCWTLLPFVPDWRWGLGERSPWYPQMRLFRQRDADDWSEVVARVEQAFAAA